VGIVITKFRQFEKNTLRGFLNIHLTNIGLEIRDATYHQKDGERWIGLPAKPYEDENGDTKYSYIIKFVDKNKYSEFQKWTLKALDQYLAEKGEQHPDGPPF
jgi:hypothetical protein